VFADIFVALSRTIGLAAEDPAHRRIASQPVGAVDVFISGKPTEHRLTQHAAQIMPPVPARAAINQMLSRDVHEAERAIEFAIGQQSGIRGDARTMELQLEAQASLPRRPVFPRLCCRIVVEFRCPAGG
jgi:hypothetical protein